MCAFRTGKARRLSCRFVVSCLLFGLLVLASDRGAKADTYVVTTLSDSGVGSLRQAILNANAHSGADMIVIAPGVTGTISLMTALPVLSDDVEIDGPGANLMTIAPSSLASAIGILQIDASTGTGPTVSLSGLTLSNGNVTGGGGGLKIGHGNVTIKNCTLSGNRSDNFGGEIANAGVLVMIGCTVHDNGADTSSVNTVAIVGGGIYNSGTLSMTNCTLSDNYTRVGENMAGQDTARGGGIYNSGALQLSHCTLALNEAFLYYFIGISPSGRDLGQGGTIYNTGSLTLDDTILLDAFTPNGNPNIGGTLANAGGIVVSQGYNLCTDAAGGLLTGTGDKVNATMVLGPLQNNGGRTPTHNLLHGSPAVDAGNPAFSSASATDQRGFPRVIGKRIDIGAVEFRPPFDFDGDGHNDLLFQNSQTGQVVAWYTNGLTVQGGVVLSAVPDAGWNVVGCADFNDDGSPDLVFQNTTTKQIVLWYMNGSVHLGGESVIPPGGAIYSVAGGGDFNGDGKPDLVLQDSVSGQIVIWYMSGAKVTGQATVAWVPAVNFRVVGVGDFNRDGQPDLLFQNTITGQLVVWYMNGAIYASGNSLERYPVSGWQVKGVADYNNDGYPDIVFQNTTTGKVVIWFMNDLTFMGGDLTTIQPLALYQVVGPR
ncbi:MAG: multicopper oxidase, type 2 [Chthonomonadaceae bacterium]|nr:multicopper oxidase, type 2 [Chthonomonadaceae bacterium]